LKGFVEEDAVADEKKKGSDKKDDHPSIIDRINKMANERQSILRKGSLGAAERRRIDEITRDLEQLWMERRIELAARHRAAQPGDSDRMAL
jgi:hypothetical protein